MYAGMRTCQKLPCVASPRLTSPGLARPDLTHLPHAALGRMRRCENACFTWLVRTCLRHGGSWLVAWLTWLVRTCDTLLRRVRIRSSGPVRAQAWPLTHPHVLLPAVVTWALPRRCGKGEVSRTWATSFTAASRRSADRKIESRGSSNAVHERPLHTHGAAEVQLAHSYAQRARGDGIAGLPP